jgi:serpin B
VGGLLSMVVIVPDEGAFAEFEAGLDGARLHGVLEGLGDAHVQLGLPRFEFRTQAMLRAALGELGMPVAFTDDADFSGMGPQGEDLLIQDVVHEAFISVDEEGTEAAAATAVIVGVTSAPQQMVELTVDRPFLFVIRDGETGVVLFMGRVTDPTSE